MTNIVVTGFMGAGKSTIGQEVAHRLGRHFVDMDSEIERRAGESLPDIFSRRGEAVFREMETVLCQELSSQNELVIATGGGALVNPINRERMSASGTVVCLTCTPEETLRRVEKDGRHPRPLLHGPDSRAEMVRLLESRREAYGSIPWQIDTTDLTAGEVATLVIQLAHTITLPVRHPGGEYVIHIGDGLLDHVGGALRAAGVPPGGQVAIVCNPTLNRLFGSRLESTLRDAKLLPLKCTIPDREQHKTLSTVAALYDQFLSGGLDRSGVVLSLGGGVTGDVAGFAAATYMRGVNFVQVPTTLLAMVDASVGGKAGVDLPQGKNLVGAFKQPLLVVIDPTVLSTLPIKELRSGMAEMLKHGIIGAPDLFAELEVRQPQPRSKINGSLIARALRVKIDIVEQDPFEQGRRAVLNLGHTVGHALEGLSGFSLQHGAAVGIGMVATARIAEATERAESSLGDRIAAALQVWGLPVRCPPVDADDIWHQMSYDKKRRGQVLRWILPCDVGSVEIATDISKEIVISILRQLGARSDT